jgi:hypothetical protein
VIEAICIGVEAGIVLELERPVSTNTQRKRGNHMTTSRKITFQGLSTDAKPATEDEAKVARAFGISTDAFAARKARNASEAAARELRVAANAAGLVKWQPPVLLNRGPVAISFRG